MAHPPTQYVLQPEVFLNFTPKQLEMKDILLRYVLKHDIAAKWTSEAKHI